MALADHDGNTTSYSFDPAGRLISVAYPDNNNTGASLVTIQYQDSGRRVERTDQRGIVSAQTFDDLGRPVLRE